MARGKEPASANTGDAGSIPGLGTKNPQAAGHPEPTQLQFENVCTTRKTQQSQDFGQISYFEQEALMLGKDSQKRVLSLQAELQGLPFGPFLQSFLGAPRALLFAPQCLPTGHPTASSPRLGCSAQLTRMGREGSRQATWITVPFPCRDAWGSRRAPPEHM